MTERHDAIVKLRKDNVEIEEKMREALSASLHRADIVKQLKEELKLANGKVCDSNELTLVLYNP